MNLTSNQREILIILNKCKKPVTVHEFQNEIVKNTSGSLFSFGNRGKLAKLTKTETFLHRWAGNYLENLTAHGAIIATGAKETRKYEISEGAKSLINNLPKS